MKKSIQQGRTVRAPGILGQRLFFVLVAAYVGFILAWNAILRLPTASRWPVQLLSVFDPWLYVLVVPLLVVAALGRDRRAVTLLAVPMALFALQYGQLFLPALHSAD